ncbi:hypothetical protein [Vitiosangium sp. GDMCC 1.1324]|uniref:hypothetical protein n=1 Tax=Vitiosangium sp. (strain GDMCC 1.1324) TaxID=2138576 RepID=UPI000D3C35E7|nr:hypothetical protein [Vitiosangium sp. GDMCC 1.1324]PTL75712.1 hypothetical protein DAT35_53885 [Vitiosangium sp. GDMCC 1.1324]
MRHLSRPSMLLATLLLTACGAPLEDDASSAPDTDDSLASQTQAVDDSCVNSGVVLAQPDGAAVTFQYPHCSFAYTSGTSNDGTYDQPLCPNRFVTEVQQVNNQWFEAFVEAIPASTMTESACKSVAIVGTAWGYNGVKWVQLGTVSTAGIWHPATTGPISFPAYCQLYFPIANVSGGYSKVRVTGMAAALGVFKGRVRTGVYSGPGPC